jgi:hypothetical protein
MKIYRKPVLFWAILILVVALLSIPLASVVENGFIQPLARFFWILNGYYGSINQSILWSLALAAIIIIAGISIRVVTLHLRIPRKRIANLPGEVGQLAYWMHRARHGTYPRWFQARTLANLALNILQGRGADTDRGANLQGPGWEPPGEIQPYLETALRTTPATFSRQLESIDITSDPDAESIIAYVESYMENSNDH